MKIKRISFDELPVFVRNHVNALYKQPQIIQSSILEFDAVPPLYVVSVLDLDRNIITEVTFDDDKGLLHENVVTLGTVLEAIKKYPERFGLRLREEMKQ
ncbi:hypothetical protein GGR02_002902 [Anoxybacillus voinovskiensis]|uniref:Uncharacterized protein n=3 Tax=Anoxybacillaceae TaxID=3120669 RepID=A0A2G5RS57_9BACL|nr:MULTISPECIES: hypothetical protein [Bacillaceae]KFZ41918.1 hypothetical protein JS80_13740 [Anoxybacillus sp. KU2-6(11)]MBB4075100.1 hypothetical protein [Anoxybacillus voinovskiensis]MEB3750015.1 hypothetical protein [Geobacillus icigianus]PIC05519.1 hypothetical protein CS060_04385 [Anoxybacillus flavithermus]GGJ76357.1 hypothetical protein GCM10008982_27030 [Anoxybacillus voinovskiensis]